ncbi:hypothetical protein I302_102033 [Kwoniella bestiolae CBS 10118]|uniref:Uncharacterized protein n=1 Tax=Kwoniella bestiolae CBS 10118 TaxID=1296100 RepID=A0A1B9GE31_9TREE|nr:hypothetical protein I302_00717 [Kwoniella bestiolae CBS 10118]OCF29221.1 hypothetical protein I302_00717 [Kwoniella bestiolae CBS 10118]
MKFTSQSKPSLTPVGYRLLSISERKLSVLDGSFYDEGPELLKGVLVKESIKNAWRSVQEGSSTLDLEVGSYSTIGLDVISEDEEYNEDGEGEGEVEVREERWFEDLLSSFGEDDFSPQREEHEWVESNVSEIVFDDLDLEYDSDRIQAFTFPSPTMSPTIVPQVTITGVDDEDEDPSSFFDHEMPSHHHRAKSLSLIERFTSPPSAVEITPILKPSLGPISSSTLPPPSPIEPIRSDWDQSIYLYPQAYYTECDYCLDIDEFSLPPPLIRSLSSSSTASLGEEEEECGTPPLRYSELNEQPSWVDSLKNEDDLVNSDEDEDEDDELGIEIFTEDQGKVLGGVVGMALGFNEDGFVLV